MKFKTEMGDVPESFARSVAEAINVRLYKENLQATAELIAMLFKLKGKEAFKSSKDYADAYTKGFNTYACWKDLIKSLGADKSPMAVSECHLAVNKTIFRLPCGYYIWMVA